MVQRLNFGGFILLRPEALSRYAAVVRKVRKHPQELGCIREDELLAGDLDYQDFKRLPREDEAVVLRTLLGALSFPAATFCSLHPYADRVALRAVALRIHGADAKPVFHARRQSFNDAASPRGNVALFPAALG